MFLTISKTDVSRELVLEYYKNNFVYIDWTANKDINSPHYLNLPEEYACYGNIHTKIDTIKKRTKENIYSYMIKTDKQAISWGFNLHKDAIGKLKPKELWYIFYTVEQSLRDVVEYDPSIAVGRNLEKLYERLTDSLLCVRQNTKALRGHNWL